MVTLAGAPAPTLHLAGEHTVPEAYGTVHAAFLSGIRAAAAVLDSL
jgi:monoamine oxidase